MKQIRFRAWDNVEKIMLADVQNQYDGKPHNVEARSFGEFISERIPDEHYRPTEKPKYTIMQYTGLKDKNGVEIFEGDIIKSCFAVRAVEWGEYSLSWMLDKAVELGHVAGQIEVIGNIYSNPELVDG